MYLLLVFIIMTREWTKIYKYSNKIATSQGYYVASGEREKEKELSRAFGDRGIVQLVGHLPCMCTILVQFPKSFMVPKPNRTNLHTKNIISFEHHWTWTPKQNYNQIVYRI